MREKEVKKSKGKLILKILGVILLVIIIAGALNYDYLTKVYKGLTLFEPGVIEDNFRNMDKLVRPVSVRKGSNISRLDYDLKELPETYTYKGETKKISDFIDETKTTGMIVINDSTVLYEEYFRGNSESIPVISWSISKSVVSALFGIAVAEGSIKDINETVTDYLPELAKSGYNGVRIKDVLQMSSGIGFNEDYADIFSDINRMGYAFGLGISLERFINTLDNAIEPGTYNNYVSMDTQVLGMIIRKATGKTLAEYTEEKLWKPAGMEADAYWLVDSNDVEAAFGGLNAVLRDIARFGCIYLHNGYWNGKQIVPEDWVEASITPDAPHLMPDSEADWTFGYGYQWWIPDNNDGDFMGIGVYGQALYVYPRYNIVIAKTSAYTDYDLDGEYMEMESVEFFRAIARNILTE